LQDLTITAAQEPEIEEYTPALPLPCRLDFIFDLEME
jgi:hypothetical protein